jgi:hypothetical protein
MAVLSDSFVLLSIRWLFNDAILVFMTIEDGMTVLPKNDK